MSISLSASYESKHVVAVR